MKHSIDDKLNGLNTISQRKLVDILIKIPGLKDFIIDPSLIKPLDRIIGMGKLRAQGVDKIYKLEKTDTPSTNSQRVFLIRADLITAKHVCDKINGELRRKSDGVFYHVILSGRKFHSVTSLFEEEGIFGNVTFHVFQWELILLDHRILSLEMDSVYKSLFVENNSMPLTSVAKSIWSLQLLLGKPAATVLLGKNSLLVDIMVNRYLEELGQPDREDREINYFVLVDRDIDHSSVLMTGCTYTSLVDEVFGVKCGMTEFKGSKDDTVITCSLNSSDSVYSEIKKRHFSDVFPHLSSKAKELTATQPKLKNMALSEMKTFISRELQAASILKKNLATHITACEGIITHMGHRFEALQEAERNIVQCVNKKEVISYIEDCLAMNLGDQYSILRLISLLSLCNDGLFPDELNKIKLQYLHVFGYQCLPAFHNLEKAGLIMEQPASAVTTKVAQAVPLPTRRSTFTIFSQKMKLFPSMTSDGYELRNPKDMGYVFNGAYIPVVCQLVHMIIKKEQSLEDLVKLFPTSSVKYDKPLPVFSQTFFVYFLGGVTYAEIAAFQLLEQLTGSQIIVAGTSITNGNSVMKAYSS